MSEEEQITKLKEQLLATQAEYRKAQAAARRAHDIFKDAPRVDGTHALKLVLEQQYRAIRRVTEMLNKFGDRLQQKEKDG